MNWRGIGHWPFTLLCSNGRASSRLGAGAFFSLTGLLRPTRYPLMIRPYLIELLVDAMCPLASISELSKLWKRLAQVLACADYLSSGSLDAVEGFLLSGFEPVKTILKPGDQPSRVDGPQIRGRHLYRATRHPIQIDHDSRLAHGLLDGGNESEAAKRTWMGNPRTQSDP